MDWDNFALARLADTGEGGMLNLTLVDRDDPRRRAVIVYDHESGEFFESALKTGRKAEQLGERDAVRLLAVALSQVAAKTGLTPV